MSSPKPSLDDLRIDRGPKTEAKPGRGIILLVVLLLVLGAGAAGWKLFSSSRRVPVHVAIARQSGSPGSGSARTVLNASGYVTARRAATVSSKITGKVTEVLIEEGMKVQEGQILARLDDTNVKTSLNLAEAQLKSAQASLAETRVRIHEAELNLRRIGDLAKNKISAQAELEHAEADEQSLKARLAQQEADVTVAERTVSAWKQQMEDTTIRAPFTGIVTSKNAQPGEMISPISAGGGFTRTGICTIVDMASLEVEIDVNESYINRIESHQPGEAILDAYQDWKIPCKVIAIIPTADRQKSTVKVRVGFDKIDPRILPEMSVKVAFRDTGSTNAVESVSSVVVPANAVQEQNGQRTIWVLDHDRAEKRKITVKNSTAEEAFVSAGISAGDKIILDAPAALAEGAFVKEIAKD